MQITVDSNDRLQDVLRLVGSLYDVELTVAGGDAAEGAAAQNGTRKRASAKRGPAGGARRRPRRTTSRADAPDLAAVRAWAREHGHQVSDRGRVPNAVLDAYKESAQAG
jgi:hypothetical protein